MLIMLSCLFRFFILHGLGWLSVFQQLLSGVGLLCLYEYWMWRLKLHGFSTLNVVIHMIRERGISQHSISADLSCFCLWAVLKAVLRLSHSSNSHNYICEFLTSEVLQKVAVCVYVCVRLEVCAVKDYSSPKMELSHFQTDNHAN